jgi:hypothetical protein
MKSVLNKKDAPKPLLETAPLTAAEFVVGPGATFKKQAPPHTATAKNVVFRTNASEVKLLESSVKSAAKAAAAKSDVSLDTGMGSGVVEEGRYPPVIGEQQLEVISELLKKGSTLRDKMVMSLAAGTQVRHCKG